MGCGRPRGTSVGAVVGGSIRLLEGARIQEEAGVGP